jgi:hypothetical protein
MKDQCSRYEVIAALVLDRSVCVPCIAAKVSVSVDTVEKMLDTIASALVLRRGAGRCVECGDIRLVHELSRQAA